MNDLRDLDLSVYSREYNIMGRMAALLWIERRFGFNIPEIKLTQAVYATKGEGAYAKVI